MPDDIDWMIVGDFNLMRKQEDRNKEGGDLNEMFLFNDAISALGISEIVQQGRKYTWSNMQPSPLLQKIDWIFTSNSWSLKYLDTAATGLEMTPSDHCPCLVNISTEIPRLKIFRFKNYWLKLQDFQEILNQAWLPPAPHSDCAKIITAKFKKLRKSFREKQASLPSLKATITNVTSVIQFLGIIEEYKDLSLPEWNFRAILKDRLLALLE